MFLKKNFDRKTSDTEEYYSCKKSSTDDEQGAVSVGLESKCSVSKETASGGGEMSVHFISYTQSFRSFNVGYKLKFMFYIAV